MQASLGRFCKDPAYASLKGRNVRKCTHTQHIQCVQRVNTHLQLYSGSCKELYLAKTGIFSFVKVLTFVLAARKVLFLAPEKAGPRMMEPLCLLETSTRQYKVLL